MVKIVFIKKLFEKLKAALRWDGKEKMLYILCHASIDGENIKVMPDDPIIPSESDYVSRSAGYYEVHKTFVSKVFNQAIESQRDVVTIHIHPKGAGGRYSAVDKRTELEIMRHISEQINGIFYLSIVFSNDFKELDSWYYDRQTDSLKPVDKVTVVGKNSYQTFTPTRLNHYSAGQELRYDRTIKAYGKEAVQALKHLDIGVIGASALGGPIIEMLAREGVASITICEPDNIDDTNLNRLPGTTPKDIGRSKAEFYAEYTRRINPDVKVKVFKKSFYESKVQKAFAQTDIIFGCVDSGARFSINRLALSNLIPYFDLGATILREKNKVVFEGGQVFSVIPGREVCLECSGVFDNLKSEFWSEQKRERERKQGYLNDSDVPNPLVAHLDAVIAGLGYHQMLNYIWGTGNSEGFKRYIDLTNNKLMMTESSSQGCIYCQPDGLLGNGDKVAPLIPDDECDPDVPAAPPEQKKQEPLQPNMPNEKGEQYVRPIRSHNAAVLVDRCKHAALALPYMVNQKRWNRHNYHVHRHGFLHLLKKLGHKGVWDVYFKTNKAGGKRPRANTRKRLPATTTTKSQTQKAGSENNRSNHPLLGDAHTRTAQTTENSPTETDRRAGKPQQITHNP